MGRAFHLGVALIALAVYLWAAAGQRQVSRLPAAMPALSFPARIDGMEAGSFQELRFLAQRFPPSTEVDLESGGRHFRVRVEPAFSPIHHSITILTGLIFWAVCFFVFAPRGNRGAAGVFFWGLIGYGLAVMSGGIYCPAEPLWPNAVRPVLRILSLAVIPVVFVHISLVFPKRNPLLQAHRRVLPLAYGCAATIGAWRSRALIDYLRAPGPHGWQARLTPDRLGDLLLVTGVASGCVLLARGSRGVELERERLQAKWVWWGVAVGASPFAFLYTLPRALGLQELVPLSVARLFAGTVPLAFAFAVARHRLFDIDLIIRRSLIYGSLAALLAVVYGTLALIASRPFEHAYPGLAPSLPLLAAIIAVALFAPTRASLGRWVDRTFFKLRYNYGQALAAYRVECGRAADDQDLADLTRSMLERTLRPKRCAVVLTDGRGAVASGLADGAEARTALAPAREFAGGRNGWLAARDATSLPESEVHDFAASWADSGWRLAYPLFSNDGARGVLLLGEKETERRYVEPELEFVSGVALEAKSTAERLRLVREVAEETVRRTRLADLDRLKTDFLFRIAHDLRTPLTSIRWSADNLLDGLAGGLNERQAEYLDSIRSSAGQLGRLVANLLEISRLEEGRMRIDVGPVQLEPLVSECVATLLPQREAARVSVRSNIDPELGPVRGERDRLADVLFNLLENAIRYSPPDASVEVTVLRSRDGWQSLSVEDRGPGVPAGQEELIFERFYQGVPSPFAPPQGFGLGLYVVRSYVELLGGSVHESRGAAGGARFECQLPEWTARPENVS